MHTCERTGVLCIGFTSWPFNFFMFVNTPSPLECLVNCFIFLWGRGVVKGCIVYILAVHKLFNEVIGPLSFGQEAE